ncbi:MAG TPA: glycoside hydrolase family 3 N-terminal domain-containing protein [Saprospiraceae bacterium]|nr:glycoside hydrolase family 3 N-terminal domain-containing protein [Saprospiraceae bacterium]
MDLHSLLQKMTLAEKVGQMTQVTIDALHRGTPPKIVLPPQIAEEKLDHIIREKMVGSILNVPSGYLPDRQEWQELVRRILEKAQETRLQIPILYGIDAIHGVNYCKNATLFAQPISVAASFNPGLAKDVAAATAYECRAISLPWNFSPALDVGRHPAWPRLWESFGEDVYLNQVMGRATVKGYQGETGDRNKVAACLKHFTGYGLPLSGKDRTPAWIPERYLREYFLPAYEAAIEAGALSIMVNSGEINGVPVHASHFLLTKVLREEMGFEGLLVTDWWDIVYLHTRHRIAPNMKEAVRLAIEAGIDMSMTPFDTEFTDLLIELVEEGRITEARIDTSVRRILELKAHLGLFERAVNDPADYALFGSEAHRTISLQSAREALVLLKNEENLLPLSKDAKLLICGPAADNQRALNGGWTANWQGDLADEALATYPSILAALREKHEGEVLEYRMGVDYHQEVNLREAIWKAPEVDYIILCLGEDSYTEDAGNISDLYLDEHQTNLALAMVETGKPVILILAEGRPRLISPFADRIPAIVGAFYPGPQGGRAIAELIFGELNPNGKLPFTYPKFPNSLVPYDHKHTEEREVEGSGPNFNPQFTFGHGLSYTHFRYSALKTDRESYRMDDTIHLSVKVENTGSRPGKEIVMVFIRDDYASVTPPVKRLRAFRKISLNTGEVEIVEFVIQPSELAFVSLNNEWITEPGTFTVMVSGQETSFEINH